MPLELKYTVDDILDKYDDIKKLERVFKIYLNYSNIKKFFFNRVLIMFIKCFLT